MPHYKFSDLAYNITDKKMPDPGDEKTYIGLEHLDSGSLAVTRWGSEIELKGQKLVMKKGDVLFGRRNTYLRRAAISPHDGIFSAHGMIFRPKTEVIDPDYFPFFIASDYFMNAAIRISVGSLSPTVNWKTLKELEFDIPTLEQQRESAKILNAANELKESYQALLLKTDELVKSQFIEEIGTAENNPHNYEIIEIGKLCTVMNGFAFQSKKYVESGIKVIRITNVQKGKIVDNDPQYYPPEAFDTIKDYMLEEGDLLMSLTGNCGRVGLLPLDMCPAALNQRVACLRLDETLINKKFMFATLNMDNFENDVMLAASGTAQKNMSTEWLKKYKVLIPPMEVQEQFADFVQQSDKSKFELKQAIEGVDLLIKSMIQQELN